VYNIKEPTTKEIKMKVGDLVKCPLTPKMGIVLSVHKVKEFEDVQVKVHWFNAAPHYSMPDSWPIGTDLLEVIYESR
jgi:hypothetical protein